MQRPPLPNPKRQKPPPPPESSAPAKRLPAAAAAAAASGAHLSPAMPGPAADGRQVPFRNAKEEIRARIEVSEGGGDPQRLGGRGQRQIVVWRNVVLMSLLHLGAVYSLALIPKAKLLTLLWGKSRRRPLCPGPRGEATAGRAESPAAAPLPVVRGALSALRSLPPRARPLCPAVVGPWDGLLSQSRSLQLLPSPLSG